MDDLLREAIARFDALNSQDPTLIEVAGEKRPRELVFAERLSEWVCRVDAQPSLALRLAARSQHLMRWTVPRSSYPEGRLGYLSWRKDLSRKHAALASEVLRDLAAEPDLIEQVKVINLKQQLKTNEDTQKMEDALCLSFLEHELEAFISKHDADKVIDIVQKTWRKMSEHGHHLALQLVYSEQALALIKTALARLEQSP